MELKALREQDADVMLNLLTNDRVNQTYMLPKFTCREDALPLFRRLVDLSRTQTHFVRGIFVDDTLVGFMNDVEITEGTVELGYVIHPNHWNKGYATQALKMAIEALTKIGYRQVITGAFEENAASLRVMEKCAMVRLSHTDMIEYRGKVHRCIYYSSIGRNG